MKKVLYKIKWLLGLAIGATASAGPIYDDVTLENLNSNAITYSDSSSKLQSTDVSLSTFEYIKNLSSDAQTQLNGKQPSLGFTPENVANKASDLSSNDNVHYSTTKAVNDAINAIPTGGVTSFNSRTGDIIPQTGDYTKAQVGLGNVQNLDQTNPSNIVQDSTHRFATDSEKSTWNGKQNALGFTPENSANKGAANGYAPLDGSTKISTAYLPASVLGAVNYQGTWNASTNSPSLSSGTGTKGFYYVVSTAGATTIDGVSSWKSGDWIVFNGSIWNKVDNNNAVTSVNTKTGSVVLTTTDIAEGINEYFTNARAQAAMLGLYIGGSITVNQVPYGSGTNTVQGSSDLTFDGNTFKVFDSFRVMKQVFGMDTLLGNGNPFNPSNWAILTNDSGCFNFVGGKYVFVAVNPSDDTLAQYTSVSPVIMESELDYVITYHVSVSVNDGDIDQHGFTFNSDENDFDTSLGTHVVTYTPSEDITTFTVEVQQGGDTNDSQLTIDYIKIQRVTKPYMANSSQTLPLNVPVTNDPTQLLGGTTFAKENGATTGIMRVFPGWYSGDVGAWINLPTDGPSGVGTGGPGTNPFFAYVHDSGQWFSDSTSGDVAYRNTSGKLLFGNNSGAYSLGIDNGIILVHGDTIFSTLDADTVPYLDGSKVIRSSTVTPTQLSYVDFTSSGQTQLNGKEPSITSGSTSQYWRGDKSFQTLDTSAVTENSNLYFTNARSIASTLTGYTSGAGTVSSADSILSAIQKLNGNTAALVTGVSSVNGATGAVTVNAINQLSGDGTTTAASGSQSKALTLATVNTNVGSFGSASTSLNVTANAKGLLTAVSTNPIQIAESQVTNLTTDLSGKQATGNYLTALTGDATASGPGSSALTLATVNTNTGSFGSASTSLNLTVNGKGLVTAASTNSIQVSESQVTSLTSDLALKAPLASPGLTGVPTAPTASQANNSTQIATTAYVDTGLATKQNLSLSAYTFRANNTNGAANATDNTYHGAGLQTYSSTITWNGTAPTGSTNHTYQWTQIGKVVNLQINLLYGTAGNLNSQVEMALPADLPTPQLPTGVSGANAIITVGSGQILTDSVTPQTAGSYGTAYLKVNSGNNGYSVLIQRQSGSSILDKYTTANITYNAQ